MQCNKRRNKVCLIRWSKKLEGEYNIVILLLNFLPLYPKTLTLIFLHLLACPLLSIAQSSGVSHLFDKLKAAQHDTDKVNIYYTISRYYWSKDPDSALLMGEQAL